MRQQTGALDDVADAAAQSHRVDGRDVATVDFDATRRRGDHAVDHAHRGGLAAPGRADEHRERVVDDLEVEVIDRRRTVRELLGDPVEADHWTGLSNPCSATQALAAAAGSVLFSPETSWFRASNSTVVSFSDTAFSTAVNLSDALAEL